MWFYIQSSMNPSLVRLFWFVNWPFYIYLRIDLNVWSATNGFKSNPSKYWILIFSNFYFDSLKSSHRSQTQDQGFILLNFECHDVLSHCRCLRSWILIYRLAYWSFKITCVCIILHPTSLTCTSLICYGWVQCKIMC